MPRKSKKADPDQVRMGGDDLFGTRLGEHREQQAKRPGSELFIVDNSDDDWKVRDYLHDWCQLSKAIDIATGNFEIGALLALDGEWQKVDHIRILMGDEVTLRTKRAFVEGLQNITNRLDDSIEAEKEKNDFLVGVPAIVDAIPSKIQCKVYRKNKFHAKAYITHARQEVIGSFALVGSSNFSFPGLTQNVELNVQITGRQVNAIQEWYERYWDEAEDVTPDILRTIERHTRDYTPFEIYAKALFEYFRGHEVTESEWERTQSRMFPVLDQYQKDGYGSLMKIAQQFGGAFLCDGVGLGKTFIGLMLIERLVMHERKRVVLFVPKSIRKDVWERDLRRYLPHLWGDFSYLAIFNHTDLGREGEYPDRFEKITEMADAVVIDEAHHFRNLGIRGTETKKPSRYRQMSEIIDGPNGPKQVFMLTATPINNSLHDFRHMIELFSREKANYFGSTLGIHSLRGHFGVMENNLKKITNKKEADDSAVDTDMTEAEYVLTSDPLFRALVVQRSRAYVKISQEQEGGRIIRFPERKPPKVAAYSVKKTYGGLLAMIEKAFARENPLFALAIYYPVAYPIKPDTTIDPMIAGRQKQVVRLIRTQFLKRFESSAHSFERSCDRLLLRLLSWVTKHSETPGEKGILDRWKKQHAELIGLVQKRQLELWGDEKEEDSDEDIITEEMLEHVEYLSREEYDVRAIMDETYLDLAEIARFLEELRTFKPKNDDKLQALIKLLKTDPVLKQQKVIIFTEFAETARYLKKYLVDAGIEGVEQIDSGTKGDRGKIIRRFSPYYNESSTPELAAKGKEDIRILIATDVLAEGLNLQDATRLINYDLHWNPVRLMQRIGRVDRRMNPEIEDRIIADHPEQKDLRGIIEFWNFLPPDELEELLKLYNLVSNKTLRISKIFGIEGKKLLKPEDDYDALKDFNETYEGSATKREEMLLEYNRLLKDNPDLADTLASLPGRVFSGKEHPSPEAKALFLCYRLPRPDYTKPHSEEELEWTEDAGETKWYLYDMTTEMIHEDPTDIVEVVRSTPDTPRRCKIEREELSSIRLKVEKHIKTDYLRKANAPAGVKPILKCWMELN
ncbi:MAG: helicase-related protein [Dehalococcoidia bacterium]